MLHICTALYRQDNLLKIMKSIPVDSDVIWHICQSKRIERAQLFPGDHDPVIRHYNVDCDDSNSVCKLNCIFSQIIASGISDGSMFCILDDDTLFLKEMYEVYKLYKGQEIMVIGNQLDKDGNIRLQATLPYKCAIDIGNVLFHSSVLEYETLRWTIDNPPDFDFIDRCFNRFGIMKTVLVQDNISVYNALNDKEDTLNYRK